MKYSKIFMFFVALTMFFTLQAHEPNFGLQIKEGKITYQPDSYGNRILDFSYCGYHRSESVIPSASNVIFVPLTDGDASEIIQRAINYVSTLKPDSNGIKGAVLLDKGRFFLDKNLIIPVSGVVLRGCGKTITTLVKRGFDRSAMIKIEGINNLTTTGTTEIQNDYVPVNERNIQLRSVAGLKVGDGIQIYRPSTKEWIASVGCDIFGGGISALGWKPGDTDLYWDRTVTAVAGNTITIDAPLTVAIDSKFGGGKVMIYKWLGRISESGVENLSLESEFNHQYPKDEDHCWTAISIENAENCWVRQVNFYHFAGNAVFLQPSSSQITVEDCISKHPVSELGGFRRYTYFNMGQLNLFQRCYSENGNHDFAVGFDAPGPNAFVQCEAKNANGFSGSVDAWACGLLFDVVNIDGHNLTFKNLGQDKNGAGWNTANSMFWQCSAAEIECYSPASDAKNRACGCWAQFSGNGEWMESNNHVQPRSLFYAQLSDRLKKNVDVQAAILPKSTDASSSPTVDAAREMIRLARIPLLTLEEWINQQKFTGSVNNAGVFSSDNIKSKPMKIRAYVPVVGIENGRLLKDGGLIAGDKTDVQWWNGKTKFNSLPKMKPGLTRYVPGREGYGLTDRIDSVLTYMKNNHIAVLDHNYGLWYDRRRDDHERIRRRDGDVWTPFYEQPFARSGQGTAWDGLSKYDLNRPNQWYWLRLKEFADKAQKQGFILYHENFFQHNIIEAGAHWVDCPWRSANNINDLGFPEPVNFTGDKRVFMADIFYDISNENRKNAYRNYIRQCLNNFAGNTNVVQLLSFEYTGPLHFVQFWLDVIDEWQKETGHNATVALSCTKDVQDSILSDSKRAAVVDIIDIRYWHYRNNDTTYEPKGGLSLAPRQHARLQKVGKVTFAEAYKAVADYRIKYPEKAVSYYAENYPEVAWAVFMAGGSLPVIPVQDDDFLSSAAKMKAVDAGSYYMLNGDANGCIICCNQQQTIPVQLSAGKYQLILINRSSGAEKIIVKTIKGNQTYQLKTTEGQNGIWWFKKI